MNNRKPQKRQPPKNAGRSQPQRNQQAQRSQQSSQKRQTPPDQQNRRKPPQVPVKKKPPQKKKLTKAQIEKRKKDLKKQRAEARKIFFNRFKVFLAVFGLMLAFSAGIFAVNLFMYENVTSARYKYQIGADKAEGTTSRNVSYQSLFVNRQVYINMSEIAAFFEMIITGDNNSIRFILTDEAGKVVNDVKFMLKTSLAYVNGVPVRMSGGVDIRGSDIYVPMKFFNDYVSGISAEYSPKDLKLTIKSANPEQIAIWYNLRSDENSENIPEISLDQELLYLTDPERIAEEARKAKEAERLAGENTE